MSSPLIRGAERLIALIFRPETTTNRTATGRLAAPSQLRRRSPQQAGSRSPSYPERSRDPDRIRPGRRIGSVPEAEVLLLENDLHQREQPGRALIRLGDAFQRWVGRVNWLQF